METTKRTWPETLVCCQRGCKVTVVSNGWDVPCCLGCGKGYPKCEKHGGEAAGRRSLRSHKGLCIGGVAGPAVKGTWK